MPGVDIIGEEIKRSSVLSGNISHFKRKLNQGASPRSPLSLESPSCGSIELAIDDDVDNMIDMLYHNICDAESSNDSQSTRSFTTYDNESTIDSELCHLVGANIHTDEEIKEVVVVEDMKMVQIENPTSDNQKENNIKEDLKAKSKPIARWNMLARTNNGKKSSLKPPIAKKNVTKSSRSSILGYPPIKEKNSKDQNLYVKNDNKQGRIKLDLGPYLLKKATDALSTGDNPTKALEFALRAKKSFENCAFEKSNLDYIKCLHLLASMHCSMGEQNDAIPLLERSIEVSRTKLGQNHAIAKFVGCMQLGDLYAMQGQIEKSLIHYRDGLEIQKQVVGDQDPRFWETCRYVAEAHVQAFDFDEAEKFCHMALDIPKENNSLISFEEAANRRLMGLICESKGNHEAALEHYILASTTLATSGQDFDVMAIDCNIGDAYLSLARYDEAILSYQKALSTYQSRKGESYPSIALVLIRLAELYNKVGKFGESNSYCEKAFRIYKKIPCGSNTEEVASGLIDIAAIYESMNKHDQSLELLQQALEMYGAAPAQQCTTAGIETQMGVIYYMLGNYADSYHYLKSAVSKFQTLGGKKSSLYGITLNQLGLSCVQLFEISEAVELFEEARSVLDEEYGTHHPDTLGIYSNLAATYDALGRWDDAIDLLEFIVSMREEKLGTADAVVDDEKRRLSELLKEAGRGRRRKCRSLMTLLDKNTHSAVSKILG